MIAQNISDIPQSSLSKFRIDLGPPSHLSKQSQLHSSAEDGRVRVRQKHAKVRTGCLTCKIRRKKCDEGKPFCKACERTGRKCDGYAPVTSKAPVSESEHTNGSPELLSSRASVSPGDERFATKSPFKGANTGQTKTVDANVSRSNPDVVPTKMSILFRRPRGIAIPSSEITPIEALSYSYFLERTRGHVSAYFECSIWRTLAIRTNLMHPVLFKVATALGAVHRRFASGISREAFEYCFWASALFEKAELALRKLKHSVAQTHETCYNADREVVVVGEMLLSLFQVFQGDYPASATHASTAISTLLPATPTPHLKLLHSERRYSVSEGRPRTFCRFLNALYCRSIHIFGSRIQPVASCGCFVPSTLPDFPDIFDTVELARDYLFMLVDWVMHSAERIDQDFGTRGEAHELGVRRLLAWTSAYAAYARAKNTKSSSDTNIDADKVSVQEIQARMLLKLVRNATYILLYNTLFTGIEHTLPRLPPLNESLDNDPDQDIGLATATRTLWKLIQRHQALEHDIGTVKDEIECMIASGLIFDFDKHGKEPVPSPSPSNTNSTTVGSSCMPTSTSTDGNSQKPVTVCPRDPTVWESVGTFSIAEKISDIEETALVAAIMHLVPEYVDQRSVDTTCDVEKRVIVVRYHYPDVFGVGLCRVQDWWAF